ncbi:MAG: hypothetical protein QF805_27025, partial [Pirellulaceae bacterium]|nr:hypothetical protein [Pirellulaceae bacterium]
MNRKVESTRRQFCSTVAVGVLSAGFAKGESERAADVVIVGGGHFGGFVPYPAEVAPPNARFVFHEMPCYHCFWRCDKRATKFDVF